MENVDKRTLGPVFRARLAELIGRSGLSKMAFAERVGIDRSALSQLLSDKDPRLPRAETLAAIARFGSVSLDWLLGLSEDDVLAAEVAAEVELEEASAHHDDSRLIEWRREAQGAKIRYVPSLLPDLFRLPEVTAYEFGRSATPRLESRIVSDRETLALSRTTDADMEVCMPRQRLEMLAAGEGVFAAMDTPLRERQLGQIAALLDELYPTFRLFLYDERAAFAAPYTVFGAKRAALYVGGLYLVLNSRLHIQSLSRHFDGLVRQAEVDAREAAGFVRGLAR